MAILVASATALPAVADAQTVPSQPVTAYSTAASAGPLSTIGAAPAGSSGDSYMRTSYTALAGTSLIGLDARETLTSAPFAWSGGTPRAISFSMQDRATLGTLAGVNGGVTLDATLRNLTSGTSAPLGSEALTASSPDFSTFTTTGLSPSLLVDTDSYEIVVTESIAPLLQVVGSATIDLDDVALDVTPASLPVPVFDSTGPPAITDVTSTGAQATAVIDPGSSDTTVTLDYGTTTAYGAQVTETIPADSGPTAITLPITGLSPATAYHAELVASSAVGTASSGDLPFSTTTTPPGQTAPAVASAALSGSPDERDASIGASIDPNGADTSYYVEYGTVASNGFSSATSPQVLSASSASSAATVTITGLAPDTAYQARLVANNSGGTTTSQTIAFTTAPLDPPVLGTPTFTQQNAAGTSVVLAADVDPGANDTQVSVAYGSTSGYGSTTTTQVVAADSGPSTEDFLISGLAAGVSYHFQVTATNRDGTTRSAEVIDVPTVTPTPQPGPISVVHVDASSLRLDSTIDTGGEAGTYYMEYGTDPSSLTSDTATQALSATASTQPISEALTGLRAATTYYLRLIVELPGGTSSQSQLFTVTTSASPATTTAPTPPQITTTAPVERTTTSITLRAVLDPGSLATEVYAEYGLTDAYGMRTPVITVPASAGPRTVTITIDGLTAGSRYHVRLVTANADGTARGGDLLVTTAESSARTGAPACVAAYLSAPTRTLSLLALPSGAEVTARRALQVRFPRGTAGVPRYRLAGGRARRARRGGFALGLAELRVDRTMRLLVTVPRAHRRATLHLGAWITTLPCGARLSTRRVTGSRVAVTVRSALGARRIALTLPAGWRNPSTVTLLTTTHTRSLRIAGSAAAPHVVGGGALRLTRAGTTIVLSGLGSRTTGVTLVFPRRGPSGHAVARVMGIRGGTRTTRVAIGGRA